MQADAARPESAGHKPILTKGFGARGQVCLPTVCATASGLAAAKTCAVPSVVAVRAQVDLIDFQSSPDGQFKFLLNYQDHGTKWCARTCLGTGRML